MGLCPRKIVAACAGKTQAKKDALMLQKSKSHSRRARQLRFEVLESRELLSIAPGHYVSGLVGSDSRLYIFPPEMPEGSLLAFPVAELRTASGTLAAPPRDVSCYPGYAYPGHWDKQFLDVADHPTNPKGLPSVLRSWDLSVLNAAAEEEGEGFLQIPVVTVGNVYMDNPAYPGPNQPRYLDVRLNALEWSPELPDGTRLLFGAGYAGIAGQNTIRGHYLFVINQHYAKARPVVNLSELRVESAGDIAFGPNGVLYLGLKGGKLLAVKNWDSSQPVATVHQLTGQWEDFDSLLPGEGNQLIGIAQDGDWYEINLQQLSSQRKGTLPLGTEVIAFAGGNPSGQGPAPGSAVYAYGAFFGSRRPDDLGTITGTVGRNSIRPYLFQRWYRFDVGQNGTIRIWITQGYQENPGIRIKLYQQINGGPLLPVSEVSGDGEQNLELTYTRGRADSPGMDVTYYVHFSDLFSPISFRVQVVPGGPWPKVRLGVLGDMLSQEYAEHWFINGKGWYDLLAESGRVDGGHYAQSYPDIRWQGYEYNWANWWATTGSIFSNGQLDGLVAQAQSGLLSHVVVILGSGDYMDSGAYAAIYNKQWTSGQIAAFDNQRLSSLYQALSRLTATGVPVILSTVVDPGFAPGVQGPYSDPAGRARVSQAVDNFNQKLRQMAAELGVPVIDSNGLMKAIFGSAANPANTIWVGGVALTHGQGNEPQFTFTANGICPGTVISGLWAGLVVHALNQLYNANLPPVSVQEILQAAGLGNGYNPAGPSLAVSYSQLIELPTLLPGNNAIDGMAWQDNNRNGRREPGESPAGNVTIQLYSIGWDGQIGSDDDRLVGETVTNSSGQYVFTNLRAGTYYLRVLPPPGSHFTYYLAGSNSSRDSDIVPPVGTSRPIQLEGGMVVSNIDVGLTSSSILQAQGLGRVDYRHFPNRQPSTGQLYYQFESTRAGLVSVNLDTMTPEAVLLLTDATGKVLGYCLGAGQVDAWADAAGQTFFVWVGGIRSLSHLAIGNLVEYDTATKQVTIRGSSQRDTISIAVEPTFGVQINQLRYSGVPEQGLSRIVVRSSRDIVRLQASSSADRLNVTPGRVTGEVWINQGLLPIQLDNWDGKFELDLGLGVDVVRIGGAPAESAEVFEFGPGGIRWRNSGFDHRIWGAEDILVVAGNGGNDSAFLVDPRGSTVVEAGLTNPQASRHLLALHGLTAEGYAYRCAVRGFQRVIVDVPGATDRATLYDSPEFEDRFFIDPAAATLVGPSGLMIKVTGAELVQAYGSSGTVADRAVVDGSAGDDRFEAEGTACRILWGGDPNRSAELRSFGRVTANARGGADEARFAIADPTAPVELSASAAERFARIVGPNYRYEVNGFRRVYAGSTDELAQTISVLVNARATLVDSGGHDFLYFLSEEGELRTLLDAQLPSENWLPGQLAGEFQVGLRQFGQVTAESRNGGTDVAVFAAGSDGRFIATPEYAVVQGNGYRFRTFGFDDVIVWNEDGLGPQSAVLYGSEYDDTLQVGLIGWRGLDIGSAMRFALGGPVPVNYYLVAVPTVRILADGLASGGVDQAQLMGIAGVQERFSALTATRSVVYWAEGGAGNRRLLTLEGFQSVQITGNASQGDADLAVVIDSPGNDWLWASGIHNPRRLSFEAVDHVLTLEDLAGVTAVRFFGGADTAEIEHREELEFELELVGDWLLPGPA
ncbi:MAG: SdrD B-like domain-containing protein [Thermoguttaceae bacterium]|nr:SdrD B-like domain-containing protein [Thermoguttaceae bacterium]